MENQTRNLTTFLTGTVLYVLFYSYVGSIDFNSNLFLKRLFNFFIYIVIADGFAMAILYKNFYKQTIFTEVNETLGTSGPKMTATDVEPITEATSNPPLETIQMLDSIENHSETTHEGFAKDSANGSYYTTNGTSNAM